MNLLILVTRAAGYVGGHLLKALLAEGHRVRCPERRPEVPRARGTAGAEVMAGDILDASSVRAAETSGLRGQGRRERLESY